MKATTGAWILFLLSSLNRKTLGFQCRSVFQTFPKINHAKNSCNSFVAAIQRSSLVRKNNRSCNRKHKQADIFIIAFSSNIDDDNEKPETNDTQDKQKSIASLCNEILEKEIDENQDALFTLLNLKKEKKINQERVKKLMKFLEHLDLATFEDVGELTEEAFKNIQADFHNRKFDIEPGTFRRFTKLRDTLLEHTTNYTPTKSLAEVKKAIENLLHEWLKRLPKKFDVGIWDDFKPGFPKQPGLVMPLDITVEKRQSGIQAPSMILYGLKDLSEKKYNFTNPQIAEYIEFTAPIGPSCIYGVSGSGKTRCLYEFASRHYSMYFLASGSTKDLGSYDLHNVMQVCNAEFKEDGNDTSQVSIYAKALVYARLCVFSAVCKHLERTISAYEWLLLQLSPLGYGGTDIFNSVARQFLLLDDLNVANILLEECAQSFQAQTFYIFVDEAQNLFDTCKNKFLSNDNKSIRSLYTALIGNLSELSPKLVLENNKRVLWCPVTAGTGLKHGDLNDAMASMVAKFEFANQEYNPVFSKLDPLKEEDVRAYLEKFMLFDTSGNKDLLIDHVCVWLKGRPRFAASFVQSLMKFGGNFDVADSSNDVILNHLYKFIDALCLPQMDFPPEWSSVGSKGYLYDRFEKLKDIVRHSTTKDVILDFLINLMLSIDSTSSDDGAEIVEYGLGYAVDVNNKNKTVGVRIFEPIVIQAAIQYYARNPTIKHNYVADELLEAIGYELLQDVLVKRKGRPASGVAFETFVAFNLHRRCDDFLNQYDLLKGWSGKRTIGELAYGVLAKNCVRPKDTITWLKKMINAPGPGYVPPICLPDKKCGPDLIFFLHQPGNWEKRIPVLVQVKYRKRNDVTKALQTVNPKKMYVENREETDEKALNIEGWDEVKKELFHEKPVIRIVLQYPGSSPQAKKEEVKEVEYGGVQIIIDGDNKKIWKVILSEEFFFQTFS